MEEKPNPYRAPNSDDDRRARQIRCWIAIGACLAIAFVFFNMGMAVVGSRNVARRDYVTSYVFITLAALSFLATVGAFVRFIQISRR
jgi:hypothetical protein